MVGKVVECGEQDMMGIWRGSGSSFRGYMLFMVSSISAVCNYLGIVFV